VSLATRLLNANPGAQVTTALTGALTTPGAKQRFSDGSYVFISSTSLASDSSYIELTNIPATYKHLRLVTYMKDADPAGNGATRILCSFNGDTNDANYYNGGYQSYGTGTLTSFRGSGKNSFGYGTRPNDTYIWGTNIIEIPDYTNTTKTKVSMIWGAELSFVGGAGNALFSHQWTLNSAGTFYAINSLRLSSEAGYNLKAGSKIAIYGLKES
jgi:hypothetical protein